VIHKDYQDFKSIFDENGLMSDENRSNMNQSMEYQATIKTSMGEVVKKRGKSTARSRKDIIEVSNRNT
jgi:hypothetical protein